MKIEKVKNLVANLHNKTECFSYKKFNATFKPWTCVKTVYREIKSNQKSWLKPYIDMNTDLTKAAKNGFKKDFFQFDE